MNRTRAIGRSLAGLATCYDEAAPLPEIEVPADLTSLDDDTLAGLHEEAVAAFDALYGDGQGLSPDQLAALSTLADVIDNLRGEIERRATEEADRAEAAAGLAQRVRPEEVPDPEPEPAPAPAEEEAEPEPVAAAASIRVSLPGLARRQNRPAPPARRGGGELSMADIIVASADVPGFSPGQAMSWPEVGRTVDRRLMGMSEHQFEMAAQAGRHIHQQFPLLTVRTPFEEGLTVTGTDTAHVEEVLNHAVDEHRLPGNSLIAAGGWCAPSTIVYDLCELESRDGLFSLPTISVTRGGIQFTMGPDFADLYNADVGFCYTEAQDIAGEYAPGANPGDPNVVGDKPCFSIDCPSFTDHRMNVCGLCITSDLLQLRGYPEYIARVVRGVLVAHDHRMAANTLAQIEAASDQVTMPSRAGATVPILDAIELQTEHWRYVHRASRSATLEAVFPFWVNGAIRSDMARRLGVDFMNVTDAMIASWFAARHIAAQFTWNWQDITGPSSGFTKWPDSFKFLLYNAGTWVSARTPIITLDTVFDTNLTTTQNKYTALFTEEGLLTVQRCHDSRCVTVPICPDGSTHGGVDIACDGSLAP